MKPRNFSVDIRGISPILFNKDLRLVEGYKPFNKRDKTDDYEKFEERYWKEKAHYNSKGFVILPDTIITQSLIYSQTRGRNPIAPAGEGKGKPKDMRFIFTSGLLIDSPYISSGKKEKLTKEDLKPLKTVVTIPGGGSVLCTRPVIENWFCTICVDVIDDFISKENLSECLEWIGCYCGWGGWSVRNGGKYGRFTIHNFKMN